ncbi:hypothetical protein [Pseudaestuariivita rosea]|uniref:hypothetical protein n=1 Tax=Pseudaestuariivita rosea TaxID=2763263 RepID=UPI001ABBCB2E|nr:hypothetical protein [Pseudaestuariivita rosea]
MMKAKASIDDIAKAFAVTTRHVRGRLRLAKLPTSLLEALRRDEITLNVAAAYTVSEDTAAQETLFQRLSGTWQADHVEHIKRTLMMDQDRNCDRLGRFVGCDEYEAAGGVIREDLFGEDIYFTDSALLQALAESKLDAIRQDLLSEGWLWAEATLAPMDWQAMECFARTYPQQVEISTEEEERYNALADLT